MRWIQFGGAQGHLSLTLRQWEFAADEQEFHDANWIAVDALVESFDASTRYEKSTSLLSTELVWLEQAVADLLAGAGARVTFDSVDGDLELTFRRGEADMWLGRFALRRNDDPAQMVELSGVEISRAALHRLHADLTQAVRAYPIRGRQP